MFIHRQQVHFEDVDYARVVHFPRLFSFCHRTFEAFFPAQLGLSLVEAMEKRGLGFPMVHADADFREPFRLGDMVRIELEFTKVSQRSFTHRYRLFRGDAMRPSAEVSLVSAVIQLESFGSAPLPDDLRAEIGRHAAAEQTP